MHFKILLCLLASALAAPPQFQGYSLPSPNGGGGGGGGGGGFDFRDNSGGGGGGGGSPCGGSQAQGPDGSCAEAEVTRNIFVFQAPEQPSNRQNFNHPTPKPKLNYNIVFVRTPEGPEGYEPVVVPPAQQKTIVYVLSKEEEDTGPQIIQMPDIQPHAPEVFYINYREGDNPQLPIGVDLQTALAQAISEQGQQISGGSGGSFSGGNGGFSSGGSGGSFSGGSGGFSSGGSGGSFSGGSGGFSSGGSGGSFSGGSGGFSSGGSGGSFSGGDSGFNRGNGGTFPGHNGGGIQIGGGYTPPNPNPSPNPPSPLYNTPFGG